jgi:hypothetical protein
MGKYDPLSEFLSAQQSQLVPMRFAEVERVLGFKLPGSKRYPAWWSNNPSNNPMTKVWLDAGYMTEQVDIPSERLVFRRLKPPPKPPQGAPARSGPFPGYGALKGTVRVPAGVDLSRPADEAWGEAFE